MDNIKKIANGYEIVVYKEFFDREIFFYIANKYHEKYSIHFEPCGEEKEKVKLTLTSKSPEMVISQESVEKILHDMEWEQFQIDILNRTREIRDAVYEKAFSPLKGKL